MKNRSITAGLFAIAVFLLGFQPASAAPKPTILTEETSVSSSEWNAGIVSNSTPEAKSLISDHIDISAKKGVRVSASSLKVAKVKGMMAVWPADSAPPAKVIQRRSIESKTGKVQSVAFGILGEGDQPGGKSLSLTRSNNPVVSGATWSDGKCYTYAGADGDKVNYCWGKFYNANYKSTYSNWAYTRTATAMPASVPGLDPVVTYLAVAMKPRPKYKSRFKGTAGYWPTKSTRICQELGTVSPSIDWKVVGLSVDFPVSVCADKKIDSNLGIGYHAGIYDTGKWHSPFSEQIDEEAGIAIKTSRGVTPYMSDWTSAQFDHVCRGSNGDCSVNVVVPSPTWNEKG